jgi:A/G-specific adenine glycosylase
MSLAGDAIGESGKAAPRAKRGKTVVGCPDAAKLLAWYERERRALPWRAAPGERADPYRVWLSEIMLQQTRVETVIRYYEKFLARFPTVDALAATSLEDVLGLWAGLGYYARARNLHACARTVVAQHRSDFPSSEDELRKLPGIGAYTAAAIAAIAFSRKAAPVDGNIERVVARLYAIESPLPAAKAKLRCLVEALVPDERAGDFAQAMMDLGATICTPRRPACRRCPWQTACRGQESGMPENFPFRIAKAEGKLRRGVAYVVRRADDAILLRSRPANGLLGGMTEVPTTEWTSSFDFADALRLAPGVVSLPVRRWRRRTGAVRHVFTHFPLELAVLFADVPSTTPAPQGMRFVSLNRFNDEPLPTLMRKVIAHALRTDVTSGRQKMS